MSLAPPALDTAGADLCETHLSIALDTAGEDLYETHLSIALDTAGEDLCEEEPGHVVEQGEHPAAQDDPLGPGQCTNVLKIQTYLLYTTRKKRC